MSRKMLLASLIFFLLWAQGRPALAGLAQPLADLNTAVEDLGEPLLLDADFVALGSSVLFVIDDGIHGLELWKSDGTVASTALVADVCPGACSARPQALTVMGGSVYFAADDGAHGREVWRTDGTAAGTVMVQDVWPGLHNGFSGLRIVAFGGLVAFAGNDGLAGEEIWVSDGTAAGTRLVADIRPGPAGSLPGFRVAGSAGLLFSADDGSHGREPWISDGTAPGTAMLGDLNPSGDSTYFDSAFGFLKENLALPSGLYLFTAHDDTHGDELWATDGSAPGTVRLGGSSPHELTEMDGTVYFTAYDEVEGYELWATDGTPGGTARRVAIRPGSGNSAPVELTKLGGQIYFRAFDDAHGQELWVTDGTAGGTHLVKDVRPGTDWAFPITVPRGQIFTLPSGLYFFATDGVNGIAVWHTDGTEAGTALVHAFGSQAAPASQLFYMGALTLGSRYFFRGASLPHGYELWSTDGTDAGTGEVANVQHMTPSLVLSPFTGTPLEPTSWGPIGSNGTQLLFEGNDGASGNEPWAGLPGGFSLLADTLPGNDWSYLTEVTPFGDATLFVASGASLWKTDGTADNTAPSGAPPGSGLTLFAGVVAYDGYQAASGNELWRTDGTADGSALILDIRPGTESSAPRLLTVSGGALYFTADDGTAGRELWKSDGVPGGTTVQVKDVQPGAAGSFPDHLADVGGTLFFAADDGVHGRELWTSDGTDASLVKDIRTGPEPSLPEVILPQPALFAVVVGSMGSTFFFVADDGVSGEELWKSDGTAAGTVLVKDIRPGAAGGEPRWLTAVGSRLFFSADDGVHGRELWVSDGSDAGTVLLDLVPGAVSSLPRELAPIGSALVFSAFEPASGVEPWASDGTAAGTHRLDDIAPGTVPSSPSQFRLVGSNVYFAANDGDAGAEPWWMPRSAVSPAPLSFYTVDPCRVLDTRDTAPLASGAVQTFSLEGCGVPATAAAVAVNLTVLGSSGGGHLTVWPAGAAQPPTSTLNFSPGQTRANNAVLGVTNGAVDAQAFMTGGGNVELLIDVSGFFQ